MSLGIKHKVLKGTHINGVLRPPCPVHVALMISGVANHRFSIESAIRETNYVGVSSGPKRGQELTPHMVQIHT